MLCCRIRNVRMQAFAGDRPGLLPTRFQRALSTSISNEKRMNLLPPFECLNTRHWPVFNDYLRVICVASALVQVKSVLSTFAARGSPEQERGSSWRGGPVVAPARRLDVLIDPLRGLRSR